jgi:hypothetical protein
MPIPGPDILRRISEFAATAGLAEQEARQAALATSTEIDQLMTAQSDAFRELAQLYLPRLDDDVERDGWSEMQATLNDVILRKEDARRQLTSQFQTATEARVVTEARWKHWSDRVHELNAKCEDLARQLSDELAQNEQFQALSRQAAEDQARLEQAQASLEDVEKDATEKLPTYDRSRLFRYLHDRSFGTESYVHRGLVRRLDRWLSRLIDYPRAGAGYNFLTSAPRQMRQLIAEQQNAVESVVTQVESQQTRAALSLGLPEVQSERTKALAELETATPAAEHAIKAEELARQQLADLEAPDCPFYREALAAFQGLIQRTERSLIAARAAQTPELTDDQVVARLKHIDNQVSEKKRMLDDAYQRAEQAAQRTSRINELASKCRRAQFDDPRRVFDDGFDLESQLNTLLSGSVDADSVYQEMYRHQHLDSPIADKAAAALEGPMAQILLSTMAVAAGAALGAYAARAGQQHRLTSQKRMPHRN